MGSEQRCQYEEQGYEICDICMVGAVGAHILHGFVDFVWYDPRILFMFWAVAAMLICGIIRGQEAYCG